MLDSTYVSGGLLFSIDDRPLETGRGYGYAGFYDWTHKEYALTAGKHTLKWVYQLSMNASGCAKLDNVYVGEPVHPSEIVLQDTAEVGMNCRVPLTYEVFRRKRSIKMLCSLHPMRALPLYSRTAMW